MPSFTLAESDDLDVSFPMSALKEDIRNYAERVDGAEDDDDIARAEPDGEDPIVGALAYSYSVQLPDAFAYLLGAVEKVNAEGKYLVGFSGTLKDNTAFVKLEIWDAPRTGYDNEKGYHGVLGVPITMAGVKQAEGYFALTTRQITYLEQGNGKTEFAVDQVLARRDLQGALARADLKAEPEQSLSSLWRAIPDALAGDAVSKLSALSPDYRAVVAKVALNASYEGDMTDGVLASPDRDISELLADLRHLCDKTGLDFAKLDRVGHEEYLHLKEHAAELWNGDLHDAARHGYLDRVAPHRINADSLALLDEAGKTVREVAKEHGHLDQIPAALRKAPKAEAKPTMTVANPIETSPGRKTRR